MLSREVKHVKLSGEERKRKFKEVVPGMPEHIVGFLTWLEEGAKGGMEERMNQVVEELTGRKPMGFEEFARENKGVWE